VVFDRLVRTFVVPPIRVARSAVDLTANMVGACIGCLNRRA